MPKTKETSISNAALNQKLRNLESKKAINKGLVFRRYILTENQWLTILDHPNVRQLFTIEFLSPSDSYYSSSKNYLKQQLTGKVIKKMTEKWDLIYRSDAGAIEFIYRELKKDPNKDAIDFFKKQALEQPRDAYNNPKENYQLPILATEFAEYFTEEEVQQCLNLGIIAKNFNDLTAEDVKLYVAGFNTSNYYQRKQFEIYLKDTLLKTTNREALEQFIKERFFVDVIVNRRDLSEEQIDLILNSDILTTTTYSEIFQALLETPMKKYQFIQIMQKWTDQSKSFYRNQLNVSEKVKVQMLYHLSTGIGLSLLTHADEELRQFVKQIHELNFEAEQV